MCSYRVTKDLKQMFKSDFKKKTALTLLCQICLCLPFHRAEKLSTKPSVDQFITFKSTTTSHKTRGLASGTTSKSDLDLERKILNALQKEKLIGPKLVSKPPKYLLKVSYKSGPVLLGTQFDSDEVIDDPILVSWPYEENTYYTLMVIGPDVPSKENPDPDKLLPSWEHWLIGNIPGNNLSCGDVLSEYVGITGPEYEEGTHRLIFLVYKQNPVRQPTMEGMQINQTIMFEESLLKKKVIGMMRAAFYPRRIAKKYAMMMDPIAVNYCVVRQTKPVFVQPTLPPDPPETPEDSEEQEDLKKGRTISTTTTELGSIVLDKSKVWM